MFGSVSQFILVIADSMHNFNVQNVVVIVVIDVAALLLLYAVVAVVVAVLVVVIVVVCVVDGFDKCCSSAFLL